MNIRKAGIFFLVLFSLFCLQAGAQTGIDKEAFFNAMENNRVAAMDAQLSRVSRASGWEKEAFEGAMLMRKSGTLTVPAKKLAMFKQGAKKLEAAISNAPNNAEYRFLRLMVQENAPKAIGYNKNISQDSKFIKENFRSLSPVTQSSVTGYSKKSKALAGAF